MKAFVAHSGRQYESQARNRPPLSGARTAHESSAVPTVIPLSVLLRLSLECAVPREGTVAACTQYRFVVRHPHRRILDLFLSFIPFLAIRLTSSGAALIGSTVTARAVSATHSVSGTYSSHLCGAIQHSHSNQSFQTIRR